MNTTKFGFLALLCCTLINCSSGKDTVVTNQHKAYLSAKSIPALKIPPGTSKVSFKNKYPAPSKVVGKNQTQVNLIPPGLYDT